MDSPKDLDIRDNCMDPQNFINDFPIIYDMKIIIEQQKEEISALNEITKILKYEVGILNQEMRLKSKECKNNSSIIGKYREEMNSLTETVKSQKSELDNLIKGLKGSVKECENDLIEKLEAVSETVYKIDQSNNSLMRVSKKLEARLGIVEMKIFHRNEYFLWKVGDFAKKKGLNGVFYSDCFYSHQDGFKMWLCLFPGGTGVARGTHMSLNFQIIKGENDDKLIWPFHRELTLGIVHQDTAQMLMVQKQVCTMNLNDVSVPFNFSFADIEKSLLISNDSVMIRSNLL